MYQINLEEISIEVILKDIKNIYLRIIPPCGKVRISAPKKTKLETVKMFAIAKLNWIKKHQVNMLKQSKENEKTYTSNESHDFLGKKYLLNIAITNKKSNVIINDNYIILNIKPHFGEKEKKSLLQEWYRQQLVNITMQMIAKWEKTMHLQIAQLQIRKMKTRWGSCNIKKRKIIINLELVKKPPQCLEYVVVHEMVHLFEKKHNQRFKNYMTKYLPNWHSCKEQLNLLQL
jgi:predicted metal-dependent hydrolase